MPNVRFEPILTTTALWGNVGFSKARCDSLNLDSNSISFYFVVAGVLVISALAFRLGWTLRIPLLAVVLAIQYWFLQSLPSPSGDHAGLMYVFAIVPLAASFLVGAGWGQLVKSGLVSWTKSIFLIFAAIAFAAMLSMITP